MSSLVDLHLHTAFSDGTDSPSELIAALKACNITTFAVCDHDTFSGCDAVKRMTPEDMTMISGIEFSCKTDYKKCHILGLGVDTSSAELQSAVKSGRLLREHKLLYRLSYLKENYGIEFEKDDIEYLKNLNSSGKPHLARILVKYGLSESIDSAIRKFLKFTVPDDRLDAQTAISAIRSAGGVPVWAHPLGGEGERRLTEEEFKKQLLLLINCGITGLECYYSRYNDDEIALLLNYAKRNNLFISGGSDYHGENKNIKPGQLRADNKPVSFALLSVLSQL